MNPSMIVLLLAPSAFAGSSDADFSRQFAPIHAALNGHTARIASLSARPPASQPQQAASLRSELLRMVEEDQQLRGQLKQPLDPQLLKKLSETDARNTARMKEIISQHGWPGKSLVGEDGTFAAFILVQHADQDPAFQKSILSLMEEAAKKAEIGWEHVAYLTDRVLLAQRLPQRYGTQAGLNPQTGEILLFPVEDEKGLDALRKSIGLPPVAEYIEMLRQVYTKQGLIK